MEAFFTFCNDAEQDVRTNANECLNKLINSKFIEYSAKIQNELVKELKNESNSFSVVSALNRLTAISHLMRPSRSKAFFVNLVPCLIKLSEQTEDELIQESLNEHIDVLMQRFIKFGSESEVTSLLNAFIKNLYLDNKSAKRTAANCLTSICEHSKKKYDMVFWLLNELFKQLCECHESQKNGYLIGTFLCLKTIKPLLQDYRFQNRQDVNLDLSLNFEDKEIISLQAATIKNNLLLFYLVFLNELNSNDDNQVINILLEFLQTLLKSPAKVFQTLWSQPVVSGFAAIADDQFDGDAKMRVIYEQFLGNLNSSDSLNKTPNKMNFLEYTLKVVCVKFLLNNHLTNRLKSDEEVRVLVKSLALNCSAKLIEHQPSCLRLVIFEENDVRVIEVLQYANHPDSNLTGQSSLIAGSFLRSKLALHSFNSQNLSEDDERLLLELFFRHLYAALENKSSVHLKLVLTAIKNCINELLNSNSILNLVVIDLLKKLVTFASHPYWLIKVELLEIFSLLNYSQICFIERNLSTKFAIDSNVQLLILNSVFYNLLVDNDHRVRSATIKNLIKLIPKFYFSNHNDSRCDEILALAKRSNFTNSTQHSRSFSFNLNSEQYKKINIFPDNNLLPHSFGFIFPFSESRRTEHSRSSGASSGEPDVELNLKTIVSHLISNLLEKLDDKLTLTGILEALTELTDAYPTTRYVESWNIPKSLKLVEFLFTYLTTTQNAILDLNLHTLFLRLITNLVCGCAYNELKENSVFRAKSRSSIFERSFQLDVLNKSQQLIDVDPTETESMMSYRTDVYPTQSSFINSVSSFEQNWGRLGILNPDLKSILRKLTVYFIRLLHVYSTVFGENQTETSRSFLTQVFKPNFSPLKRTNSKAADLFEKSDLFKKFSENKERQNSSNKKEVQYLSAHLYTNDTNLVKLHESIRKMYLSTMNTLDFLHTDPGKQNKLIMFLNEIFLSFSKVLELGHHSYFGRLADELVQLILPIFTVQSANCIQFVKQLVKVLFGTNFSSIYEFEYPTLFEVADPSDLEHLNYSSFINETSFDQFSQTNVNLTNDLHSICLLNNYERFKDRLSCLNESSHSSHPAAGNKASRCELEREYYNVFYRKLFDKRLKSVLSQNYSEFINESLVTNCLQIVQPLLVDSMKNYTCRSDLQLHCSTLNLLNELVKVRISYANLDNDQTFFTFLNKQFEFIENEQISSDQLVESIFGFLITLSYDKSSYALLTYPKIIQAMGNLQASDANFELNVYPALSLIVEDLFLIRTISNSEDLKELETRKEFIINLLIKSAHLPKIIYLLNIILIEYKLEGEEKVKKLSRQITDQLLQNLAKGHVNFSDIEDVNIIMKLFLSVNPVVFRPVDFVLNGIFSLFDDDLINNQTSFLKFFSHKLILFNVLVGNSKEDIILNRLDDLKCNLANLTIQAKANSYDRTYALPVFCRIRNADKSIGLDSKQIIAEYLVKLVQLALERLVDCDQMLCNEENLKFKEFLSQLLNQVLMNIYYIVREGQFPKIKRCLVDLLKEADCLARINVLVKALSINCPILVLQWLHILVDLNLIDKSNPHSLYEEVQEDEIDSVRVKFERILAGSSLTSGDFGGALSLNQNSFLFRIIKKYPLIKLSKIDRHLYSPQLELIRRNKYLISFNYLTESSNYLKEEQWLNEQNVLFFILHNKQQSIGKIFKLISLDADLSIKFIEVLSRIDLDLDRLADLNGQRIPILIVERLLVFCSLLHEKSNRLLIEYLLNKLYSNPKFTYTVALRKTMLQIVNQKLKSFSFLRNGKDERLSREQITLFIQNLKESNGCGLKKCLDETVASLNDYLNALDLSIGSNSENTSESEIVDASFDNRYADAKNSDAEKSDVDRLNNQTTGDKSTINDDDGANLNRSMDEIKLESEIDKSQVNCVDKVISDKVNHSNFLSDPLLRNENNPTDSPKESDPPSSDTQTSIYHSLAGSEEKPDDTADQTTCPNQSWLIDVLLNKPTFNKSADLFTVLNSNFSVHELVAMLEDRRFTRHSRQIEFATNVLDHVNNILEDTIGSLSLDASRSTHSASNAGQFLKNSKFSLVLAVRQVFVRICDNLFAELQIDSSPYFAYLKREELLFDEEIDSFNRTTTLFSSRSNRRKLIKLSSLFCSLLEHIDLVMRFDQVRKRCILNQPELSLRNDEHIEKLIKFDRLDYGRLLRTLMLYCELMQFEISTGDENYVNDCLMIVRSFVRSDFLMNILAAYQFNTMQLTLIAAVHSFYRKRFDLFSTTNCTLTNRNFIPKHFQSNPSDQPLKYKHCQNACLKVGEIIDFILKQSNELICKDNHLLQNRKLFSSLDLDNLVYITLVLARLPLVNRFILVPREIWRNDWQPNFVSLKTKEKEEPAGGGLYEADTFCATLPSEQLFDSDTLQTFINLINLVGFTNRIQFEEIWMSLLGVISLNVNDLGDGRQSNNEDLFIEEVNEKANLIVLAIKGITSILLQCSFTEIGFPIKNLKQRLNRVADSGNDDFTRKKVFLNTKYGAKLLNLNKHLDPSSNIRFAGLDKDINESYFESLMLGDLNYNFLNLVQFTEHFYENRYGLYSTEYLKKKFGLVKDLGESLSMNESSSSSSSSTPVHQLNRSDSVISSNNKEEIFIKVYKNRENNIVPPRNRLEIDVNSCIHFLLDFYTTMFKSHIAVQEEVLKSLIKISDLFFDLQQFNKNIEQFFDLFKTAFSQEDEILLQYLILGICKFYTVTHETMNDNITLEKVKKCVEICLKSQFFTTRVNCLVGLNYLLADKLNAINKGRPSASKDSQIFAMLKDYVMKWLFERDL